MDMLYAGFLGSFLGSARASGCHMSTLSVMETESPFGTALLFLRGQLWKSDCINVHGIGILGHSREGGGEGLEGLSGPSILLGDLFSVIPLVLEVGGFHVPVINFIWDCAKGHDLLHEWS